METMIAPDEPQSPRAASADDRGPVGLEIRCPCCNAGILLEEVALRVVRGPTPRRLLTLAVTDPDLGLEATVRDVRRQLIELALRQSRGVKARAAELVGLKYSTFWEMAERLGCDELPAADVDEESGEPSPLEDVPLERVERVVVLRAEAEGPPMEIEVPVSRHEGLLRTVASEVKLALARRALDRADGNVARAAELVGMKYTTFHSFLRRLPEGALEYDDEDGGDDGDDGD